MIHICQQCQTEFSAADARTRYCSPACQQAKRNARRRPEETERPTNCKACRIPIEQTAGVRARMFCSQKCRRADFRRRHTDETPLDADGEILVRELEDCPRRLKLARLMDRFEGGLLFYQGPSRPTWLSPPRAGR